jgi:hypothetical protein
MARNLRLYPHQEIAFKVGADPRGGHKTAWPKIIWRADAPMPSIGTRHDAAQHRSVGYAPMKLFPALECRL